MITLGIVGADADLIISKGDLLQILQTLDRKQLVGLFLSDQEKAKWRFLPKRAIIHHISQSCLKPVPICSGAAKCIASYNRLQERG